MKKSLLLMACIGACALLINACSKEKNFDAGIELDAQAAQAYRQRLTEQATEAPSDAASQGEHTDQAAVCYYTAKGGKWHTRTDCQYLINSAEILEGTRESAAAAGKNEPCSRCAAAYVQD